MQTLNSPYIPPLENNKTRPPPPTSFPKQNHTPHSELPPSDSRFDRSKLSDNEFIGQLLFENKELKSVIESQLKIIAELQLQLKSHNISPQVTEVTKQNGASEKRML